VLVVSAGALAGDRILAQAQDPERAVMKDAIRRVIEERARGISELSRAGSAVQDSLRQIRGLAAQAASIPAPRKSGVEPGAVRALLLETENLRIAAAVLEERLRGAVGIPRGAFAPIDRLLQRAAKLQRMRSNARGASTAQIIRQIEHDAEEALATLRRDEPRPSRILHGPLTEVRRDAIPQGTPAPEPAQVTGIGGPFPTIGLGATVTP
jgi:hypothetical protein